MTAEQERQLKADLLIEIEEKDAQLRLLRGPLQDWGHRILALGVSLKNSPFTLTAGDFEALEHISDLVQLVKQGEALQDRLVELLARKKKIFPE